MTYRFGGYRQFFETYNQLLSERKNKPKKLSYQDSLERLITLTNRDKETGLTTSEDVRLSLVKPVKTIPPQREDVNIVSYTASVELAKQKLVQLSGILSIDIETKGTDAENPDHKIIGIGISNGIFIYYFDMETNSAEVNQYVMDFLTDYNQGLVCHNFMFEGAWFLAYTGKWLDWRYDTYGLARQLMTEGFKGQRWGLKELQVQLLKWEDKGDIELDTWLIENGYVSNHKAFKLDIEPDTDAYWKAIKEKVKEGIKEGKVYRASKGEMWRAPSRILGYYCGLDIISTHSLLVDVFLPLIEGNVWGELFLDYHQMFIDNTKYLCQQQLAGIAIDYDKLTNYHGEIQGIIKDRLADFLDYETVAPAISLYNQNELDKLKEKEPPKFKKQKVLKAPEKYKKNGEISKAYLNYLDRKKEIEATGPEIRSDWLKWEIKYEEAKQTNYFNSQSTAQLQWLFFNQLGYTPTKVTESGNAATGKDALPFLGTEGKLLKAYKDKIKEESFVNKCLEKMNNGKVYIHMKNPGTLTGRLAGAGGLNIQQIPKSQRYLECWRPIKGKAWISYDFSALENVVLAELSHDKSLWKLYGPDANPAQDSYLFNGYYLPIIGDKIRAAGYNPDTVTEELKNKVKKECKKERSVAKVITLSSNYGAGPNKIKEGLLLQGIDLTIDQVREIHSGFWNLYGGIKEYEKYLLEEYKVNNGWVLNGIGRPIGIAADMTKDIVNRVCQSTGHDILMLYIQLLGNRLEEENIHWSPLIMDFHDETMVECDEQDTERVCEIMGKIVPEQLNDILGGKLILKMDGGRIMNLAEAKCE